MPQMQLQIREAKLASMRQFPTGRFSTPILFRVAVAFDEALPSGQENNTWIFVEQE